jgi:hypothetical protein
LGHCVSISSIIITKFRTIPENTYFSLFNDMKGLNMLLNITSLFLSLSYITMFMSIYQQYLLCAILEEMLS